MTRPQWLLGAVCLGDCWARQLPPDACTSVKLSLLLRTIRAAMWCENTCSGEMPIIALQHTRNIASDCPRGDYAHFSTEGMQHKLCVSFS